MVMYDDPRVLRAIAHPTRNRVLHELSAAGSLRAADIARRIDVPANQASFHLRQLAKYGLVEEDPDAGRDRRDRVWRLVDLDGIRFRTADMLAQPGGRAAYSVFRRTAVEWGQHLVASAFAETAEESDRRSVAEYSLLLSPEEARALSEEVGAVIERYRDAGRAAGAEGEERLTYSVLNLVQPFPGLPEDQPDRAGEPGADDAGEHA